LPDASAPLARLAEPKYPNSIYVLAGVNGAGKSSVLRATFLWSRLDVFNPDEATELLLQANPDLSRDHANILAWERGRGLLETAIDRRDDFAFETTLGGNTITALLERALDMGQEVYMLYVGLEGPGLHIARVKARVAGGGHDVPEARIRERYNSSRLHVIQLLPRLTELRVCDNTQEADPAKGVAPVPNVILHTVKGNVVGAADLNSVPVWAKPIVAAALDPTT
jgi:predicted ABC-type ATPase